MRANEKAAQNKFGLHYVTVSHVPDSFSGGGKQFVWGLAK